MDDIDKVRQRPFDGLFMKKSCLRLSGISLHLLKMKSTKRIHSVIGANLTLKSQSVCYSLDTMGQDEVI